MTPYDETDGQNFVVLLIIIFVGVPVRINTVCNEYAQMQNTWGFCFRMTFFFLGFAVTLCDLERVTEATDFQSAT